MCVVVGVGPGNGAAFVRRFALEGYAVAMIARSTETMRTLETEVGARPYVCDVGDAAAVESSFASIRSDLGPVDLLVYNVGKAVFGTVEDLTPAAFEAAWRANALGAFTAARSVVPAMKARSAGQIIFIGATASRRGGARMAAFGSAKAAQRMLAESLARSLGPVGIHVALIVVDGIVNEPAMRARFADKPDAFFVKPEDVADMALMLTKQKRSAWTFELEARPFGETW
ncbi:MAG: SDR family NAD(P)-dependent oxidoreductase [Hyphomicrobiaceae bacterium]|nr:SDR family NAD(P)-dependent oxidoreductase [Hyphomicrobiaceae bacterium]